MPLSSIRWAQLLASGLLVLATFASAKAQEAPLDPNRTDIPLPAAQPENLEGVNQLAQPEITHDHCQPAPGTWYPPVYYPDPSLCCPTGVVHRDWFREKTVGFFVGKRQRMLEKDYQWAVENGHQPVCCPPHSCWGHSCECCPGVGCRSGFDCFGHACDCDSQCAPCNGQPCNGQAGCIEGHTSAVEALSVDAVLNEPAIGNFDGIELAGHFADDSHAGEILLVGGEESSNGFAIETAGYHCVSDSCTTGRCLSSNGNCYGANGNCYGNGSGHFCPLHRRHCFHGYYGRQDCEECPEDQCDCPVCCLKRCCKYPFCCLYSEGDGGWRREIPLKGNYYMAYPVNPYHFDERDGRIYAAQGYGHPVGVPLAPNVQHTYEYGWGLPSSRLVPVSRMPGAPGVANPAGVAGPGILPPASPYGIPGALMNIPQ